MRKQGSGSRVQGEGYREKQTLYHEDHEEEKKNTKKNRIDIT